MNRLLRTWLVTPLSPTALTRVAIQSQRLQPPLLLRRFASASVSSGPHLLQPSATTALPAPYTQERRHVSRRGLMKRIVKNAKPTGKEPRMRMSLQSMSQIYSPYSPGFSPMNLARNFIGDIVHTYRIKKFLPSFKARAMRSEVAEPMYRQFQQQLASGDEHELQKITTQSFYGLLREGVHETARKLQGARATVESNATNVSLSVKCVRHAALQETGSEFAQVTFLCKSIQHINILDAKGNRIGGTDPSGQAVEEYVIFERQITKESANWYICCVSSSMPPDSNLYTIVEA